MASTYILYSKSADLYHVGSSKDTIQRLEYHLNKEFPKSFTAKYSDWELFHTIDSITITTARQIESHIKRMKSRVYIENIKKHSEIGEKLKRKYS